MASITYDGQSFMIDGRRQWIVGGHIEYARIPRDLWRDRIAKAKHAGLNTVCTSLVWSLHEKRPGRFSYKGDEDIRHFVELIGEAGMFCILRAGPYVGGGYDMGGLPPWLLSRPDIELRTDSPAFLETVSRYITSLAQELRDLQVTSAGAGGPILLLQSENAWTCGDEDKGQAYLGELNRYFREAGFTVPTINANDLWAGVQGEIDCWRGYDNLLPHLRQLNSVCPDKPRLLIEFNLGRPSVWGEKEEPPHPTPAVFRRLVEVLAAGGQYCVHPFHAGTYFGFLAGRDGRSHEYFTTAVDPSAPLQETGDQGPTYAAVRAVSHFASSFGRVLSHLDVRRPGITFTSPEGGKANKPTISLVHATGSQGDVVFLFADDSGRAKDRSAELLLPDGTTMNVELGAQSAAWCVFDARLTPKATLDYCNLSPMGVVGQTFVCFGPPGASASLAINGAPLSLEVPKGKLPAIVEHEEMTVVVANSNQIETIYFGEDGLYIGVDGIDADGQPILTTSRQFKHIAIDGTVSTRRASASSAVGSDRVSISDWKCAPMKQHVDGSSARYAAIDGPQELSDLGAAHGYGWYRIQLKSSATKKYNVEIPFMADRLGLVLDGEPIGVAGHGPGTLSSLSLQLKKGTHTLVALAETLGRASNGQTLAGPTGLFGHIYGVTPFRVTKPKIVEERPTDLLAFQSPLWGVHPGDSVGPQRLTWTFTHRKKTPLIISLAGIPTRALILLNGEPIRYIEGGAGMSPIVLDQDQLNRGKNVFQIATIEDISTVAPAINKAVTFREGETILTEKSEWAFAKWERPTKATFKPQAKSGGKDGAPKIPMWWSATFTAPTDGGLWLDATGLSKGQFYINGNHVGRYFVATDAGKVVPPQSRYYIPGPWLKPDADNELVLFDEHGASPSRIKLVPVDDGTRLE